ncbi:hypothetical protein CDL15_Pgr001102 [Punica granatum]|uniref:Uncharacterized protein n=1 Tax=Punica granatum TaxID=22663 RepID=A0A218WKF2_PUNGR|nr:hypothetical protein CDL15_Pgr001102 [Punica granatum]PKI69037.1 hypothetical protein CRG98_010506 [Punica granatum]
MGSRRASSWVVRRARVSSRRRWVDVLRGRVRSDLRGFESLSSLLEGRHGLGNLTTSSSYNGLTSSHGDRALVVQMGGEGDSGDGSGIVKKLGKEDGGVLVI